MIHPKYPPPDVYTAPATPVVPTADHPPAPVPAASGPMVRLTPGGLVTVAAGGTAAVLVLGAVLVSLLLAVAVTACSVAVCAVVLRSLIHDLIIRRLGVDPDSTAKFPPPRAPCPLPNPSTRKGGPIMPQHTPNRPICRHCDGFPTVAITTGTRHRDGSRATVRVTCPACHGTGLRAAASLVRAGR